MREESNNDKRDEVEALLGRLVGAYGPMGLENPSGKPVRAEVWPCHTGSGSYSGCAAATGCSGSQGAGVYNYAYGYLLHTGGSSACPATLRVTGSQKDVFDVIEAYDSGRLYYICCDDIVIESKSLLADFDLSPDELTLLESLLKKVVTQSACGGCCGDQGAAPAEIVAERPTTAIPTESQVSKIGDKVRPKE